MNRAAVDAIKEQVGKDGLGECIIDFYGRELVVSGALPFDLREAWRAAYDALKEVNDLLEEFSSETTEGT